MAKGAVKAKKAARKAEARAQRILEGDGRVRELLDAGVAETEDWLIVRCDGCNLDQVTRHSGDRKGRLLSDACIVCGSATATNSPRAGEFAVRKFSA